MIFKLIFYSYFMKYTEGTPYEGGLFKIKVVLGTDFPSAPPKCNIKLINQQNRSILEIYTYIYIYSLLNVYLLLRV